MLLSDVVRVIGDSPLRDFPWGSVVAETINLFTADEFYLTDESTGGDVEQALMSLNEDAREFVLTARLDVRRCSISAKTEGNISIEYEASEPVDDLDFLGKVLSPLFIIVTLLVTMIVIISVAMFTSVNPGPSVDWWKVINDLIRVFSTSDK